MNRLMYRWPLMAEANDEGGSAPVETAPAERAPVETAPAETAPVETAPVETKPVEQTSATPQPRPENLMDDEQDANPDDDKPTETDANGNAPTEDEVKSFRDGIKAIDLGEGVTFDDPALDAMQKPLMELAGKDPKKAEGLVKAYTEYRRAEIAREQEKSDAFVNGLVAESRKRFGEDLKNVVSLAKAGGRKIFGDDLWNQFKSVPQFANNPDIIERLAAFGKSTKDDPGAVRKETGTEPVSGDWRENMYGTKN